MFWAFGCKACGILTLILNLHPVPFWERGRKEYTQCWQSSSLSLSEHCGPRPLAPGCEMRGVWLPSQFLHACQSMTVSLQWLRFWYLNIWFSYIRHRLVILYIHSYICVSYLQGFSRVVYPKALVVEHHPYLYAFVYVTLYCIIWTSLVTQSVKRLPPVWETGFDPWVGKIPWRR